MTDNVSNQSLSILRSHDFSKQIPRLLVVTIRVSLGVSFSNSGQLKVLKLALLGELEVIMAVRIVVGLGALAILGHRSVSLSIVKSCFIGTVDFELVVVGSQSVSMSVCITE